MKKNLFNKMFIPTRTKVFWLYFVVAALVIIGGVILMPVWQNAGDWCFFRTWGLDIVNIMISMCIFVYLFTFLIKKITTRSNGVVKVLTIIEFVLLLIIGMFSLLEQFDIFNLNCCQILGLVFYSRGVVEIFRAYYHQKGENSKYPLWWLIIANIIVHPNTGKNTSLNGPLITSIKLSNPTPTTSSSAVNIVLLVNANHIV